jgi:hypothetical protein
MASRNGSAHSNETAQNKPKRRRIPAVNQATIIERKLAGEDVRTIAGDLNHSTTTVVEVWHDWLKQIPMRDPEDLFRIRYELVVRHEQAAHEARLQGQRALADDNQNMHARYLAQERDSLKEIARLTGADLPVKIELSGEVVHSGAKDKLADYLTGLVK